MGVEAWGVAFFFGGLVGVAGAVYEPAAYACLPREQEGEEGGGGGCWTLHE